MTIHALDKNLSLRSIPVTYRDRPEGSVSKLNTYSDGFKVLKTIFNLYKNYRPMPFFSLFAGILALLSVILFVPVLMEFSHTGLVQISNSDRVRFYYDNRHSAVLLWSDLRHPDQAEQTKF